MPLQLSQHVRMGQHQSQQMKLAPRMIQSMEILQMQREELEERIEQEIEENVALEDEGREGEVTESEDATGPDVTADPSEAKTESESESGEVDREQDEPVVDDVSSDDDDVERLKEAYSDLWEDNAHSAGKPSVNRVQDAGERYLDTMANMTAREPSLLEFLLEQWGVVELDEPLRAFGEYLIGNLDHNGRLQSTLAEVVQVYGRQVTTEESLDVLRLIQQLEPRGVGARDVRECLLLQLTEATPFRDVLTTLISSHLDELGGNRLPVIQRKTGYSIELIKAAREILLHLDPFPGRRFEHEVTRRVKADLTVGRDEGGRWLVQLEDERQPRLRLSRQYMEMLSGGVDRQTRDYLKKKLESARWLMEAIEQRANTVKRVAQVIIDRQTGFLEDGPEAIVPLKMQQVADVVEVHVTTVSRAVDGKWIQTPRGLFSLKSFFGGGTTTADGEDVAWEIIRLKMKEIIDNEDKSRPLSDDALVDALGAQGFELARRTVTKYRKKLGIPSSRQRREY
ncbi:MAG: RNA polymerase sigma-54 factor [Planctomycetaceae bacterium]|nr:RNA polymerase sigma-54 factor [Planctomycetaceae bacterium]MDP7278084.1 RNA polymerase factor sigma-54 [Planctomycetaceae bacterium]